MASVAEIDGLTISSGPTFVGLLDETYGSGATGAYSVRRLASATTVLMRVRRETGTGNDGNDDEADVGYDSNNELSLDSPVSNFSAAGSNATTLGEFLNVGTVNSITYTDADSLSPNTAAATVAEWKDQSGNSKHVLNTTNAAQPIVHEGFFDTDLVKENGMAAMILAKVSDGVNDGRYLYTVISGASVTVDVSSMYAVATQESGTAQAPVSTLIATANPTSPAVDNDFSSFFIGGSLGSVTGPGMRIGDDEATAPGTLNLIGTTDDANQHLFEWHVDRATSEVIVDTTSEDTSTDPVAFSWTHLGLRALSSASVRLEGTVQEVISFGSDKYADRTNIEGNINNHFAIGNFPNPTSGLLFDYPDAAAAYSVRQLSNTAPLSMRVRRDTAGGTGDDDEADVLFDFTLTDPTISLDSRINNASAGVASTTLGEFLNATGYTDVDNLTVVADGFCDTFYDQSGAGNDAEQDVPGSQPQIFDSASPTDLITENGKPALDFDATNTYFQANGFADDFNGADIEMSFFATAAPQAAANQLIWGIRSSTGTADWQVCYLRNTPNIQVRKIDDANTDSGSTRTGTYSNQQSLFSATSNGTTETVYVNGSAQVSNADIDVGTCTFDVATIGASPTPSVYFNGTMQELIIYAANQSSNRTDIETDIDTYFSIT